MLRLPLFPDLATAQHHGRPSGSRVGCAAFRVARRVKHSHANCGATVAGDDGPQPIEVPPEPVDAAPDRSPLLVFSRFAPNRKRIEAAEGDYVLGKQIAGTDKVRRLDVKLKALEPSTHERNVIIQRCHCVPPLASSTGQPPSVPVLSRGSGVSPRPRRRPWVLVGSS